MASITNIELSLGSIEDLVQCHLLGIAVEPPCIMIQVIDYSIIAYVHVAT